MIQNRDLLLLQNSFEFKIENTLSFAIPAWRVDGAFCQLVNKMQAHYKRNKYSPERTRDWLREKCH